MSTSERDDELVVEVNQRMLDLGMTDGARGALLDQRDRLVASVAEMVDVQASYRPDGTVALMTRSGVGLLDNGVSTFKFESAGSLSRNSTFNPISGESNVASCHLQRHRVCRWIWWGRAYCKAANWAG